MSKYSIYDCQKVAHKKGGKCLSKKLKSVIDRVIWECSKKHQWEQRFHNIRRGTWCPVCSAQEVGEKRKLTIEEMQKIAHKKGGKCLSKKYINAQTNLSWQCSCGHQWLAKPVNIKSGHWCLKCANLIPYTKQDLDMLAQKHNGRCLSSNYQKAKTKYVWECHKKHIFKKSWDEIKNKNSWCSRCIGRGRTISDLRAFAQAKGGKCLSLSFAKMQDKFQWKCSSGHQWKASAASVYRGSWCPRCKSHYNEEMCRFIIEALTQHNFPKVRLRVEDDLFKLMELDGYSKQLQLAFEYQGIQHYKFVPRFHKTEKDFPKIKEKDRRKQEICSALNIKLLTIPFQQSQLGGKHLVGFITSQLQDHAPIMGKVNFARFYVRTSLEKLQHIAKTKGGKCLELIYSGPHHRMKWQCQERHTWHASAASIKNNNSWCPFCARKQGGIKRRKHSLAKMKQIAQQHEGECLSKTYEGTSNNLRWVCSNGHVWEAPPMSILKGHWCRKCAYQRRSRQSLEQRGEPLALEIGRKVEKVWTTILPTSISRAKCWTSRDAGC